MQAYSLYFHKDRKIKKFTASGEFFFILHGIVDKSCP